MRRVLNHILRWIAGGMVYGMMEVLWRGHTHWTMVLLAAALCVPLDLANNRIPWDTPLLLQSIIGGLTVTVMELLAGLILNIWMGLHVWDYSRLWGNLWGQVCPKFALLWCLLAGAVIVLFDWIDYVLGGGERPHYKLM